MGQSAVLPSGKVKPRFIAFAAGRARGTALASIEVERPKRRLGQWLPTHKQIPIGSAVASPEQGERRQLARRAKGQTERLRQIAAAAVAARLPESTHSGERHDRCCSSISEYCDFR